VDSSVGLTAGLALAAALPELPFACGLGTASLLADDLTTSSLRPVDGFIDVPHRAPDPDRFPFVRADPATTRYWLDRLSRVGSLL
jgi:O-succinylbenzoate synthase